jgi:hypothetical protein
MTRIFDMVRAPPEKRMFARYKYRKMTPAEISAALDRIDLSVGQFSRLIGARYAGPNDSTVQKWLSGKQDAPTYLPALFALLALPDGVETARKAAEAFIEEDSE